MIERADYSVTVADTGAKRARATSAESGLPPLALAAPPEFGGPGGDWSPEHLLVGAVASCFVATFTAIAELSSLATRSVEASARGTVERGEDRRYSFTRIVVEPRIVVSSDRDARRAERIAQKAEQACLVTRSLSSEVVLEPVVEVVEEATATP